MKNDSVLARNQRHEAVPYKKVCAFSMNKGKTLGCKIPVKKNKKQKQNIAYLSTLNVRQDKKVGSDEIQAARRGPEAAQHLQEVV